jgi:protein MpaA
MPESKITVDWMLGPGRDKNSVIELVMDKGWGIAFCGLSPLGRIMPIIEKPSANAAAPVVLLTTGIHGDEPAGPAAVLECLDKSLFNTDCHWILSPLGNPDGLAISSRYNAQGVDINRDFKLTQSKEAQFLKTAYQQIKPPDLHLSLHEDWEYADAYLYEINTGSLASLAEPLLASIDNTIGLSDASLLDGHIPTQRGFISHESTPDEPDGWPEAIWLVRHFPLLSYTLETPSGQSLTKRIDCHCQFIACAAKELLKNHAYYSPLRQ